MPAWLSSLLSRAAGLFKGKVNPGPKVTPIPAPKKG